MTIRKTFAMIAAAITIMFTFSGVVSAQSLNGDWDVSSGTMFGQDVPSSALAAMALNFSDNQFSAISGNLNSGGTVIANPQAAVKTLDFKINSGSDSGRLLKAIYKIEGGDLMITFSQTDQYPQTFDSTAENKLLALRYRAGQPRTAASPANNNRGNNNVAGAPGGRGRGGPPGGVGRGRGPGGIGAAAGPGGRPQPNRPPVDNSNNGAASGFN